MLEILFVLEKLFAKTELLFRVDELLVARKSLFSVVEVSALKEVLLLYEKHCSLRSDCTLFLVECC
jgi:hypothetical protein